MRNTVPFLFPVALLALAPPAAPQASPPQYKDPLYLAVTNPPSNWSNLTRIVAADVNGDQHMDAVQLRAVWPLFLYGPAIHNQYVAAGSVPSTTVAALPGGASTGYDAVILGRSDGLYHVELNETADPPVTETAIATGTAYEYPRRLQVVDMDQDGAVDDLVVLDNAGTTVHVFYSVTHASQTPDDSYSVPSNLVEAHGLVCLDWNGQGELEIALVGAGRTSVFLLDDSGPTLVERSYTSQGASTSRIARMKRDGDTDRLVEVHRASGIDRLYVKDDNVIDTSQPLGNVNVVAIATGDIDDDGRDDLVMSRTANYDLAILTTVDDDQFLDDPNDLEIEDVHTLTGHYNTAWPIVADFDDDTDLDIVFSVQQASGVYYIEEDSETRADYAPSIVADSGFVDFPGDPPVAAEGQTNVSFQLDDPVITTNPNFTDVEVVIWSRDLPPGYTDPHVASTADYHYTIGLQAGGTTNVAFDLDVDDDQSQVYEMVVRHVELNGNGDVVDASAPYVLSLFFGDDQAGYIANESMVIDIEPFDNDLPPETPVTTGGGSGFQWPVYDYGTGTVSTGVYISIRLPCYEDDEFPTIPAAVVPQ